MYYVVVQLLSQVQLFATPWTAAHQPPLSSIMPENLLKSMPIGSVMLPKQPILWHPLLLLPSVFPSIKVFSNELVLLIFVLWLHKKLTFEQCGWMPNDRVSQLRTIGIWDWSYVTGCYPVYCRMFSSILGLYPPDVRSNTLLAVITKNWSRHCQTYSGKET